MSGRAESGSASGSQTPLTAALLWARREWLLFVAAGAYAWAFAQSPAQAMEALRVSARIFLSVAAIIVSVFAAMGLFNVWVDKRKIAEHLGEGSGLKSLVGASLFGTILVGPVYVIFPLLKTVKEHGARWAVIGAVLTSWAIKIPMIPLEISFLGAGFSVSRTVLVAVAAIPMGLLLEAVMGRQRGKAERVEPEPALGDSGAADRRLVAVLAIVAVLLALFVVKLVGGPSTDSTQGAASITEERVDSVAAFEAALQSDKPIYVLFHSLTCEPCVEISRVADKVVPEYEGRVVFVNAITDEPSGQRLAARFQFQFIPTSFFLDSEGQVVYSYTGVMSEEDMRRRLDALLETAE